MKIRYIVGVLFVLINCACNQQSSNSKFETQIKSSQSLVENGGLRIENGLIRGLSYTDSLGIEYCHPHTTNTIYNDTTVSIHLEIDLPKDYNFPEPQNDKKYKVVIWPQELETIQATNNDSKSKELQNFLQNKSDTNNNVKITIAPYEQYVLTIGTLFEKPRKYYVSPNMLLLDGNGAIPWDCKNLMNQDTPSDSSIKLALRLDIPDFDCFIISCGQFSHDQN